MSRPYQLHPSARVLRALRGGALGYSGQQLSEMLGIPRPSIRRLVFQLRAAGWRVQTNRYGYYTLNTIERHW